MNIFMILHIIDITLSKHHHAPKILYSDT